MQKTSLKIIRKLKDAGYVALWAGGTVRDFLLGCEPKDYDIVTSAPPEEIEKILSRTIPIGKKFGVILAVENGHHFEVATFRSDAAYTDGRRPDAIYFSDPKEDAKRRDFTINGMFYDPLSKKLIDYVNGEEDLNKEILRFIGDADQRIKEDNLRLLRAVRFKNMLKLEYAPGSLEALIRNANLISNVSKERIKEELTKILVSPGRDNALADLDKTGLLEIILPELLKLKGIKQPEKYHREGDVFTHTQMALAALPNHPSEPLAWATLLHDIAKPETFAIKDRIRFNHHAEVGGNVVNKIGRRLSFSNKLKEDVAWLVKHHMMLGDIPKMKRARQTHWILHPLFNDLLELLRVDALGSEPKDLSLYEEVKKIKQDIKRSKPKKTPILVTGDEIMEYFGIPEGPKIGELLKEVKEAQLEEKIQTKKDALEYISKNLGANQSK